MPLFEFICGKCGSQFELLVRSSSAVDGVVCPSCQSIEVKKKVSTFASKVSGGGAAFSLGASSASCRTGST
jgi:putative FmdB family regulatory protein